MNNISEKEKLKLIDVILCNTNEIKNLIIGSLDKETWYKAEVSEEDNGLIEIRVFTYE